MKKKNTNYILKFLNKRKTTAILLLVIIILSILLYREKTGIELKQEKMKSYNNGFVTGLFESTEYLIICQGMKNEEVESLNQYAFEQMKAQKIGIDTEKDICN